MASADGRVYYVSGSIVCVNVSGTSKSYRVVHVDPTISAGAAVTKGVTQLGAVQGQIEGGYPGNNNVSHIHFEMYAGSNCTGGNVPFAASSGGLDIEGTSYPIPPGTAPQGGWYIKTKVRHGAGGGAGADVALIVDSSGSMGLNDRDNKRLDAAKAYLTASLAGDHVAVIDFDDGVRTASPLQRLPDNKVALTSAINTIDSSGGTDIGIGVQRGCDELIASASGNVRRAAILLTDGRGSYSNQDACFSSRGWPVYTFGFGDADDALLQRIASNTGGQYSRLPTSNLVCEFQRVRALISGVAPGPCTAHLVAPGATVSFSVDVPPGSSLATFSTSWPGSDVVMSLNEPAPSGGILDRTTVAGDVVHDVGPTFEVYSVINPVPGRWQVNLFGADVPPGGEETVFGFTVIADPIVPDTTAPVTTATLDPAVPDGERDWYVSDPTVTLSATDRDLGDGSTPSGIQFTKYRVNGSGTRGWQDYDGAFVVTNESLDNKVEYYSVDNADNVETVHEFHFKLDKTRPTVGIANGAIDGLAWDQAHLERGILTNSNVLALTGTGNDNLCLWEVRAVDADSGAVLASQQPAGAGVYPPAPPTSLDYSLNAGLHTGINNIDVTAEDCAGWEKSVRIQVVYVVPGPFDPRGKGFWYNGVKTGKYTPAQFQTLLDYTNVVSDVWGNDAGRNRYGPLTMARAIDLLNVQNTNPDMEYKMEAQLFAHWLNMVSGRLAIKRPVNVGGVPGWPVVMDDIGGNPRTFAYKVALEIEEKVQPVRAPFTTNAIAKNIAEGVNEGWLIVR